MTVPMSWEYLLWMAPALQVKFDGQAVLTEKLIRMKAFSGRYAPNVPRRSQHQANRLERDYYRRVDPRILRVGICVSLGCTGRACDLRDRGAVSAAFTGGEQLSGAVLMR